MLDIQVKMCGARILYEQDMVEFAQNSRQDNFRSCNDLSRGHEKLIEDHMSISHGPDPRLKRNLKSLLSRLYQVDYARNHWYDYIFPQITIPPNWFTYQSFGPYVKLKLPAHLHDDSTWLGFTVYALYTIEKHRAGFEQDSRIFLRFSGISEDQVPLRLTRPFPWLETILMSYHVQRLLVFYIPRLLFQLSSCSHIAALFKSNGPGVKVDMCGIRLVYEQDVNKFVQTLVEYMIECPEAYHQSISLNLLDQIGMMQDCNHEKDDGCALNPDRRSYPMPMLLPSNEMIQEERTSGETFSNQVIAAGASRDSGRPYIDLGIPLVNGQFGSKMSSASTSKNSPGGSTNLGIPSMNRQGGTGNKTSSTGTSKNSSRGRSINLCIPLFVDGQCGSDNSSSLESWTTTATMVLSIIVSLKQKSQLNGFSK
nr:hypothetical protein CFP56_62022 [Quercus suber]